MTRNVESKTNNYNHKTASVGFSKITPDRLGLNAVGVARIFGPHVRLLCKMLEIW